jgi:hypothetical protein
MILDGPAGDFDVTYAAWADVLVLAELYGWVPSRTEPPDGIAAPDWSGTYHSSDGQLVSESDALAVAAALEAFLAGLPPRQTLSRIAPEELRFRLFLTDVAKHCGAPLLVPGGTSDDEKSWLLGDEGRSFLRRLAIHCRAGAFRLW